MTQRGVSEVGLSQRSGHPEPISVTFPMETLKCHSYSDDTVTSLQSNTSNRPPLGHCNYLLWDIVISDFYKWQQPIFLNIQSQSKQYFAKKEADLSHTIPVAVYSNTYRCLIYPATRNPAGSQCGNIIPFISMKPVLCQHFILIMGNK